MKNLNIISISSVLLILAACTQQPIVDQKAEAEHLMETSRQMARAETPEEMLSYWSEDAIFKAPGQPTLRGKKAIAKMIAGESEIPGFEVMWEPIEAYVSKSGDLGYVYENLYVAWDDTLGKQVKVFSKAVTIWKKQEDGNWKNVLDMQNEDPSISSLK